MPLLLTDTLFTLAYDASEIPNANDNLIVKNRIVRRFLMTGFQGSCRAHVEVVT